MKSIPIFLYLICGSFTVSIAGQSFKTIGYFPYYRFNSVDQIDFSKLTHVNIAFANPDISGNLKVGGVDITPVVLDAHAAGAEVFISLAGGVLSASEEDAWKELIKPAQRGVFIHKILQYVSDHNLQGIDVDLEWSHVDENYTGFILSLRDSVDRYGLGLTAALPGHYRYPQITDQALDAFDWINMMVYDLTGPWTPQNVGPHSSYNHALNAISYWSGQGVGKDRLTLGVPCYGYDFTNLNQVVARTYAEMIKLDTNYAYLDQVGQMYYNGIATIEAKTRLALDQLSGIMIWEIGQDDFGAYSLLDKISQTVEMTLTNLDLADHPTITVYPNPFINRLEIESPDIEIQSISLYNSRGEVMLKNLQQSRFLNLDLPSGFYFLEINALHTKYSKKVFKQ
ncbi:MAG: T9SS type A sorting domain-containing protein [Saprospiraceae bacterium]|nr:T9SS type A sorting domain-containing protein [Saprospiraceae bacterium]